MTKAILAGKIRSLQILPLCLEATMILILTICTGIHLHRGLHHLKNLTKTLRSMAILLRTSTFQRQKRDVRRKIVPAFQCLISPSSVIDILIRELGNLFGKANTVTLNIQLNW